MYNVCSSFAPPPTPYLECIDNFVTWLFAQDTCSRNNDKLVLCLFALPRWWKNTQFPTTQTFMSFCRILEKDSVNWRKVSQGKIGLYFYRSTIAFTRPYSALWACAGDRVELVGKVHRGTVLGEAFSTCGKFIFQNGPTTHLTTISTRSPAQPQSGEFELFPPVHTKGNMIACLTGHALFNVWHHRNRKPPFSSVQTKTISRRFQKSPHWRTFRNMRFRWPSSLYTCGP